MMASAETAKNSEEPKSSMPRKQWSSPRQASSDRHKRPRSLRRPLTSANTGSRHYYRETIRFRRYERFLLMNIRCVVGSEFSLCRQPRFTILHREKALSSGMTAFLSC
ncbi:hypothetical protein CC2G_002261 [Coprinopsis cinerea AmutBmut pab1-1]|nr:hypothetical protein CC2G_002261 [Coprinopsis cinerea AmutBmut pab1-1]